MQQIMRFVAIANSLLVSAASAQPLLDVSPTTGGIGTAISFTLNSPPKGGPFDDSITYAVMTGTVTDSSTSTTDNFTIRWTPDKTFVSSSSEASVVLGDGVYEDEIDPTLTPDSTTINTRFSVVTPMPCPADVNDDGMVSAADFTAWIAAYKANDPAADVNSDGMVTPADYTAWLALFYKTEGPCPSDSIALRDVAFTYAITPAGAKSVIYPLGPGGGIPPSIGTELDELTQLTYGTNVTVSDQQLKSASGAHFVITLDVEKNALTDTIAPSSVTVRAIALDAANAINGQVVTTLYKLASQPNPSVITYASDVNVPFVVTDTSVSTTAFQVLDAPEGVYFIVAP